MGNLEGRVVSGFDKANILSLSPEVEERISLQDSSDEMLNVLQPNGSLANRSNGEPLIVSRKIIHDFGLLHRSVVGIAYDNHERVLVNQRSFEKDSYKGHFSLAFGEHPLAGERTDNAIYRGMREEYGYIYGPHIHLADYRKNDGNDVELVSLFRTRMYDWPKLDTKELIWCDFIPLKDLSEFIGTHPMMPETKTLFSFIDKMYRGMVMEYIPGGISIIGKSPYGEPKQFHNLRN